MPLWQIIAYLAAGGFLLWKAGDWLVDGAVRIGQRLGIPPSLAGVFILGFGTSFPELVVTGVAAFNGNPDIAAGNVVGSNIANVGLILGATAMLALIPVNTFLRRIEIPVGIAASILALVLVLDNELSMSDGLTLLGAFVLYAIYAIRTSGQRETPDATPPTTQAWMDTGLTLLGLAGVLAGGQFFFEGAREIAVQLGMPQAVIGQTVVAIGTSLPELATALAAARANQLEMALGNIIGSNIFNLLLVFGVAGVLVNQKVDPQIPMVSMPLMLLLAIIPLIAGWRSGRIGRPTGVLLLTLYVSFLGYNVWRVLS